MTAETRPDMAQIRAIKRQHPDVLLLFPAGSDRIAYGADALTIGKALGLATGWEPGMGATGDGRESLVLPAADLESGIHRLIVEGYRVALCDPACPVGAAARPSRATTGPRAPFGTARPGPRDGRPRQLGLAI